MEVFFHAQEGQHFLAESTDPWITVEMLPRGCLLCGQTAHAHTGSVSTCSEQKTSLGATEDQSVMKNSIGFRCHTRTDQEFVCLSINKILGNSKENRTRSYKLHMGRCMGRCSDVLQGVKCGIMIRNFIHDTFLLAALCGSLISCRKISW